MKDKQAAIAGSSSTARIFKAVLPDRRSRLSFSTAITRSLLPSEFGSEADEELTGLFAIPRATTSSRPRARNRYSRKCPSSFCINRDRCRLVAEQFLRSPRQAARGKTFATIRSDLRFLSWKRHEPGETKTNHENSPHLFSPGQSVSPGRLYLRQ